MEGEPEQDEHMESDDEGSTIQTEHGDDWLLPFLTYLFFHLPLLTQIRLSSYDQRQGG